MKNYCLIFISLFSIVLFNCEPENIIDPDDFKILYRSDSNMFIMDSDGNNKVNLSENLSIGTYAGVAINDVSSDGRKILFTYNVTDSIDWHTEFTTHIMDINGKNVKSLDNSCLRPLYPQFSPDGSYVVFEATEDTDDVYIMNNDGSNIRNITNDIDRDWFPRFTPDGSKIIYVSEKNDNMDIYSINLDGTDKTNLTNDGHLWGADYCISSDGSRIVYTSSMDGQSNIYMMNIDGTEQLKLTNSHGNGNPSFSFDNTKVTFISSSTEDIDSYDIKVIDIDGENAITLATTKRPSQNDYWRPNSLFCPDNDRILFTSYNDDNNEIYIIDIDGENLVNLTNSPTEDSFGIILTAD